MIATLAGMAAAVYFFYLSTLSDSAISSFAGNVLYLTVGSVILLSGIVLCSSISLLLQKAEKNIASGITRALREKWGFRVANGVVLVFPFFSFFCAMDFAIPPIYVASIWIILLGLTIDCFHHLMKRAYDAINPFEGIRLLSAKARRYYEPGGSQKFCEWIDALSETSLKAISQSSTFLCNQAIDELQKVFTNFLKSRSLGVMSHEQEEELHYTICFFLQRIEQINSAAVKHCFELVCSKVIVATGKVAVAVVRYHPAWTPLPLNTLGKSALQSIHGGLDEVGVKSSITLQQIGQSVLDDDPSMQMPVKDLFSSIIDKLEKIAQSTFRRDKTMSIQMLTQPFHEIKHWFTKEKFKDHPDSRIVVEHINRVMGQFEALEMVLQTMPANQNNPAAEENEDFGNEDKDLES